MNPPEVERLIFHATRLSDVVDALLCHYDDRDDDPMQVRIDEVRDDVANAIAELDLNTGFSSLARRRRPHNWKDARWRSRRS